MLRVTNTRLKGEQKIVVNNQQRQYQTNHRMLTVSYVEYKFNNLSQWLTHKVNKAFI